MNTESNGEKLRQRNRELAILNVIAQALNRSVELDQALQAVLAQVAELLDLQTGWVWLLHEASERFYLAAAQNLPPALTENPRWMEGGCYCLKTYREDDLEGAANTNVIECSRLHGLLAGTDGLRFHASIPLNAHGKKMGVMNVASTDWRQLSAEELQLLYTIGDMLGIAIERAQLFDRSTQLGALEERNRLAREIHDTLAQGLTAVSLHLESADALLESDAEPDQISQVVQKALKLTRESLEEARRSVMDLRAIPLQERTLPEALAVMIREMSIPVNLSVIGDDRPLPTRIEVGLFRIAQEALTNVSRHARASRVEVQLVLTPTEIQLVVEDDGRGFDPENVPDDRFGLMGINERVKLMDGQVGLESNPGSGTILQITIPTNP